MMKKFLSLIAAFTLSTLAASAADVWKMYTIQDRYDVTEPTNSTTAPEQVIATPGNTITFVVEVLNLGSAYNDTSVAQTDKGTPWEILYPNGINASDALSYPTISVDVGGRRDEAQIVGRRVTASGWSTAFVCEYVVKPGDFASPLKIWKTGKAFAVNPALDGKTICIKLEDGTYKTPAWDDGWVPNGGSGSKPEGSDSYNSYARQNDDLSMSNVRIEGVRFDAPQTDDAWRRVPTGSAKTAVVELIGTGSSSATSPVYIWSGDEKIVSLKAVSSILKPVGKGKTYVAGETEGTYEGKDINVYELVFDKDGKCSFDLKAVVNTYDPTDIKSAKIYLGATKGMVDNNGDVDLDGYLEAVVVITEPPKPTVKVRIGGQYEGEVKINSSSQPEMTLELSEPFETKVVVDLEVSCSTDYLVIGAESVKQTGISKLRYEFAPGNNEPQTLYYHLKGVPADRSIMITPKCAQVEEEAPAHMIVVPDAEITSVDAKGFQSGLGKSVVVTITDSYLNLNQTVGEDEKNIGYVVEWFADQNDTESIAKFNTFTSKTFEKGKFTLEDIEYKLPGSYTSRIDITTPDGEKITKVVPVEVKERTYAKLVRADGKPAKDAIGENGATYKIVLEPNPGHDGELYAYIKAHDADSEKLIAISKNLDFPYATKNHYGLDISSGETEDFELNFTDDGIVSIDTVLTKNPVFENDPVSIYGTTTTRLVVKNVAAVVGKFRVKPDGEDTFSSVSAVAVTDATKAYDYEATYRGVIKTGEAYKLEAMISDVDADIKDKVLVEWLIRDGDGNQTAIYYTWSLPTSGWIKCPEIEELTYEGKHFVEVRALDKNQIDTLVKDNEAVEALINSEKYKDFDGNDTEVYRPGNPFGPGNPSLFDDFGTSVVTTRLVLNITDKPSMKVSLDRFAYPSEDGTYMGWAEGSEEHEITVTLDENVTGVREATFDVVITRADSKVVTMSSKDFQIVDSTEEEFNKTSFTIGANKKTANFRIVTKDGNKDAKYKVTVTERDRNPPKEGEEADHKPVTQFDPNECTFAIFNRTPMLTIASDFISEENNTNVSTNLISVTVGQMINIDWAIDETSETNANKWDGLTVTWYNGETGKNIDPKKVEEPDTEDGGKGKISFSFKTPTPEGVSYMLRVTWADKDKAGSSMTWRIQVVAAKTITLYPMGPSKGATTAGFNGSYNRAAGIGEGRVEVVGDYDDPTVYDDRHQIWLLGGNPALVTAKAYGYFVGQKDTKYGQNYTYVDMVDGVRVKEQRDSFFYTWLSAVPSGTGYEIVRDRMPAADITRGHDDGLGEDGKAKVVNPAGGVAQVNFTLVEKNADGNYPETVYEAVFSKELKPSDNLGDINQDAIPDYYVERYLFNVYDDNGNMVGSDLADLSLYNEDNDFIPSVTSAGGSSFSGKPSSYASDTKAFTAKLEIRGYGEGLNRFFYDEDTMAPTAAKLVRPNVSDREFTQAEEIAYAYDLKVAKQKLTSKEMYEDLSELIKNAATTKANNVVQTILTKYSIEAADAIPELDLEVKVADLVDAIKDEIKTLNTALDDNWGKDDTTIAGIRDALIKTIEEKLNVKASGIADQLVVENKDKISAVIPEDIRDTVNYDDEIANAEAAVVELPEATELAMTKIVGDILLWTPERPTLPTVEDTDQDGLPDGYEYWAWYRAKVGWMEEHSWTDDDKVYHLVTNYCRAGMNTLDFEVTYTDAKGKTVEFKNDWTKGEAKAENRGRRYQQNNPQNLDDNGKINGAVQWITSDEMLRLYDPLVKSPIEDAAKKLDSDNDGLPDFLEYEIGTNPFEYDSDKDGAFDGWEHLAGNNPLSSGDATGLPGSNDDRDAMAIGKVHQLSFYYNNQYHVWLVPCLEATFDEKGLDILDRRVERVEKKDDNGEVVKNESGVIQYENKTTFVVKEEALNKPFKAVVFSSDANSYVRPTFTQLHYGKVVNATPAKLTTSLKMIPLEAKDIKYDMDDNDHQLDDLILIHNQVYAFFGFDPAVGWSTGEYDQSAGYVARRWIGNDNLQVKSFGANLSTYTSVPYCGLDEYELYIYYTKCISVERDDSNGWFNGLMALTTVAKNIVNEDGSVKTYGADSDGDGMPDSWELYVGLNPKYDKDGPQTLDGNLANVAEYAGIDSCGMFADVPSIANQVDKEWANKYLPTDPNDPDTDGDGILDGTERTFFNYAYSAEAGDGYKPKAIIHGRLDKLVRGGGLNPCAVDTDMDGLPDGWEAQYAGKVVELWQGNAYYLISENGNSTIQPHREYLDAPDIQIADGYKGDGTFTMPLGYTNIRFIAKGMDGTYEKDNGTLVAKRSDSNAEDPVTSMVRDYDFDHDGLENYQEYLTQTIRGFRYDDTETPLMGHAIVWKGDDGDDDHAEDTANVILSDNVGTEPDELIAALPTFDIGSSEAFIASMMVETEKEINPGVNAKNSFLKTIQAGGTNLGITRSTPQVKKAVNGYTRIDTDGNRSYWIPWGDDETEVNDEFLHFHPEYHAVYKIIGEGDEAEEVLVELYTLADNDLFVEVPMAYDYRSLGYFATPKCPADPANVKSKGYKYLFMPKSATKFVNKLTTPVTENAFTHEKYDYSGFGFKRVAANEYVTTSPIEYDTDDDGMDDYYEIFHGLNPLYGKVDIIKKAYDGISATDVESNLWLKLLGDGETYSLNYLTFPWLNGTSEADTDGDGLRNADEMIIPSVSSPQPYHTDPTPRWMTDAEGNFSYTRQWYKDNEVLADLPFVRVEAQVDEIYSGSAIRGSRNGYLWAFEENEGYDTDGDWKGDSEEVVASVAAASDPQDFTSPERRQAMWFDGVESVMMTRYQQAYISYDAFDQFRQFTVECWVCPEKAKGEKDQVILERTFWYGPTTVLNNKGHYRANFRLGISDTGRVFALFDNSDAVESGTNINTTSQRLDGDVLKDGKWAHIAAAFDGKTFCLYVNGIAKAWSDSALIPANGITDLHMSVNDDNTWSYGRTSHDGSFIIGAQLTDAAHENDTKGPEKFEDFKNFYKGYVDEIRVWDGARSSSEINADYTKRYSRADVEDNRETIYNCWLENMSRNDTLSEVPLPAQLMINLSFDTIPAAATTNEVSTAPLGFKEKVLGNIAFNGEDVKSEMIGIGWYNSETISNLRSRVYTNAAIVPRARNTAANLAYLDGSFEDSMFYGNLMCGFQPSRVHRVDNYAIPQSMNPYSDSMITRQRVMHTWRINRLATATGNESDENLVKMSRFDNRSRFEFATDFYPMGNAFAKTAPDFWDDAGSTLSWTESANGDVNKDGVNDRWADLYSVDATRVLVDSDGDGIPDDWERSHGLDPQKADSDSTGGVADVMAYQEVDGYLVTIAGKSYITENVVTIGDSVNAKDTYYATYYYGPKEKGLYALGGEAKPNGRITTIRRVKVALIHNEVCSMNDFDPKTANITVPEEERVNTKPFTALDKYLASVYGASRNPAVSIDLNPDDNDADNDGIPDGWELYVGLNPNDYDDRLSDQDGDTLAAIDEYNGGNVTDPNYSHTIDPGVSDNFVMLYNLTNAGTDDDGDGLSNYAEYLITEVFKFKKLNPKVADSDGNGVSDYFEKVGSFYLGEVFADHDQIDDQWELAHATLPGSDKTYANSSIYDPTRDSDGDGWSNYAEFKAGTDPRAEFTIGLDNYTIAEYPIPLVKLEVLDNVKSTKVGALKIVAWNDEKDPDMTGVPDAIWTIGSGSESSASGTAGSTGAQTLSANSRYLGQIPASGIKNVYIGPGSIAPTSIEILFNDPAAIKNFTTTSAADESVSEDETLDATFGWFVAIKDNGLGKLILGGTNGRAVGKIDYSTGFMMIDFGDPAFGNTLMGNEYNPSSTETTVTPINPRNCHALVSWEATKLSNTVSGTYYLADPDQVVDGNSRGRLREGKNTFMVFVDTEEGGSSESGEGSFGDQIGFNVGEPMGIVRGVDVGWAGASLNVELTRTSPIFARVDILNSTTDRVTVLAPDGSSSSFNDSSLSEGESGDSGDSKDEGSTGAIGTVSTRKIKDSIDKIGEEATVQIYVKSYVTVDGVHALDSEALETFTHLVSEENPYRIIRSIRMNLPVRGFITEADVLNPGEYDVAWNVFKDLKVNTGHNIAYLTLGVRLVLDDQSTLDLGYDIVRYFDQTAERLTPNCLSVEDGVAYGARPTFNWEMPETPDTRMPFNTYPAFLIEIAEVKEVKKEVKTKEDTTNKFTTNTVYSTGIKQLNVFNEGKYSWKADFSVGDQLLYRDEDDKKFGFVLKHNANYLWRVAMLNTKFNVAVNAADFSPYSTLVTAVNATQAMNDHNYGSIKVDVAYAGYGKVLDDVTATGAEATKLDGQIRVQAFTGADFAGTPAAETIATKGTDGRYTATLRGLLMGGNYYVRAYIDQDGDHEKDAWESWGCAAEAVKLDTAKTCAPAVKLVLEDCDTDQDWLPDAWEYVMWEKEDSEDKPKDFRALKSAAVIGDDKIALSKEISERFKKGLVAFSNGFPGASLTTFENKTFASLLLGIPEKDLVTGTIPYEIVEGSVKIVDFSLSATKLSLTFGAEVLTTLDPTAKHLYDLEANAKAEVEILKKTSLTDAGWKRVAVLDNVTIGNDGTTVDVDLVEELDLSSGFFTIRLNKKVSQENN